MNNPLLSLYPLSPILHTNLFLSNTSPLPSPVYFSGVADPVQICIPQELLPEPKLSRPDDIIELSLGKTQYYFVINLLW
jgi:hypothetical protein